MEMSPLDRARNRVRLLCQSLSDRHLGTVWVSSTQHGPYDFSGDLPCLPVGFRAPCSADESGGPDLQMRRLPRRVERTGATGDSDTRASPDALAVGVPATTIRSAAKA